MDYMKRSMLGDGEWEEATELYLGNTEFVV